MRELALHLLDLAENSVAADANAVQIRVLEDLQGDRLKLSLQDNGKGMSAEMVQKVVDPFTTSRTTRKVGLGIPLLKAAAEACDGGLWIESELGVGTTVHVDFQRSHIDRMPLGDLPETMLGLVVCHPDVNWLLEYRALGQDGQPLAGFEFDDAPVKEALEGVSLCEPEVLSYLRSTLADGIGEVDQIIENAGPINSMPWLRS